MWFKSTTSGTIDEAAVLVLAQDLHEAYVAHLLNVIPGGTELDETKVRWHLSGGGFVEAIYVHADGGAGSGSNAPAQCAPVIDWHIASTYRGGHPRTYLPGIATANVTGLDAVDNTFRATLATHAKAFIDAVEADTTDPFPERRIGTVRFFSGHAALDPPEFFRYTAASVRSRLGTQRRRIGGR